MTTDISGSLRASRLLITIATLCYGIIPLLVDLTETHTFHPDWPPHARFHMVWLLGTNTSLAVLSLILMWGIKADLGYESLLVVLLDYVSLEVFLSAPLPPVYTEARWLVK